MVKGTGGPTAVPDAEPDEAPTPAGDAPPPADATTPTDEASPLAQLFHEHEAFFDADWYSAQVGVSFETRDEAIAHAEDKLDDGGYSPHPLYLVTWGRVVRGKTRLSHSESYTLLLSPDGREQNPHPVVDLDFVARENPEATDDPHGVFGWLVKHLAAGRRLRTVPDADSDLEWSEFRAAQLAALKAQAVAADRLPRWRALRESRTFDTAAETALFAEREAAPAPEPRSAPLVSIIMAALDRESHIAEAIRSVQAQTLEAWELIVVDDGSRDRTATVAREQAAGDDRIRVIERPHEGVSAARNRGIAEAAGHWVAFLDTDNTWTPRYLEGMTAALSASDARHGYAAQRLDGEGSTKYRALRRSDMFDVGNHIDLNAWVIRRDVLDEAGGFDEELRRAVDYDLIWRVAKHWEPQYVPLVGVNYATNPTGTDRITDVESFYWKDVVRSRNLVDWQELTGRTRSPGVCAVVIWKGEPLRELVASLRHVGQAASGVDEVVVVGTGRHQHATAVVHAEASVSAKVREVSVPPLSHTPLLANLGFAATTRTHVLFLQPGTQIPADGVAELVASLDDGAAVAQPVLVDKREVVIHAGMSYLDESGPHPEVPLPARLLESHLTEDVAGLPARTRVDAATLTGLMTPAALLAERGGFDALYGNSWFDIDYSLRASAATGGEVVTCTTVLAESVDRQDWDTVTATAAGALLLQRHGHRDADRPDPWSLTPFEVVDVAPADHSVPGNPFLKPPRPVLALRERDEATAQTSPLRIAVKHCAPAGAVGSQWGDTYFARDLARALARQGHDVVVDNRESLTRPSGVLDQVNIAIRGVRALHPTPGALNVLWIISHPDRVKPEELVGFDLVYAASTTWAEQASARFGRTITPLLQATDPGRFHRGLEHPSDAPQVLFVGNSRSEYVRPVAEAMTLAAPEFDVGIYGGGWAAAGVDPSIVRGSFVRNDDLPRYYAAAGVVMNDHFPTMRAYGFINNRLLDALACGTPVLSDVVPGGPEIFGDRIIWYESPADVPAALRSYFERPWTDERRREVAEWVGRNYSFDARARTVLEDIAALAAKA